MSRYKSWLRKSCFHQLISNMRGTHTAVFILGNSGLFAPTLADAEADPDPKTYGYVQTFHLVDEENLPDNPHDFIKSKMVELNQDYGQFRDVLKVSNNNDLIGHMEDELDGSNSLIGHMEDELIDNDNETVPVASNKRVNTDLEKAAVQVSEIVAGGTVDKESGKKCIDKVMMREETRYQEVMTCDHSYDERCHTSYITSYEPHQEEDCDEKFRKICWISYEDKAVNEVVEECVTQNVQDCEQPGPEECTTVYDTVCETSQERHNVEDDVVNCETVNEEMCKTVQNGFLEEEQCELWPRERCEVTKQAVTKYSPKVECNKVSREICTAGCGVKEVNNLIQNERM